MSKKLYFLIVAVVPFCLAPTAWAGLVARYTFDDSTATDSAYYYVDADGTFFGDATVIDDPNRGKVLSLDGNGDYVKILNNQVAEFSTESFSYSFWVRSPVSGTWYYFWKGENVDAHPDMILRGTNCYHDDTEVVRFSLYDYLNPDDSRKKRTEVPDTNCIKDLWTHIVCVRDSALGELRFYVNGQLEPPTPEGEGNPAPDGMDVHNNGYLYIGANDRGLPTHPANFYMGLFDDFRVYNHVLSLEEIALLANDLTDPNLASDPSPEIGESDACPDVVLSWTAGDNALSHNVYFGTSGADVTNATTSDSEYLGNQITTTQELVTLVEGETYFWRIDELGISQTWKGDVWKFTINDGKANHPDPEDGVRFVPLDKILSWRAGCFASSHDVYFGTDFNDVNDATTSSGTFKGNQVLGNTQYDPNGLDYSVNYYWRIDEVGAPTIKGEVWTFKAVSAIFDPNLRVWYEYGDGTGTEVLDSSGREYDGQLQGDSRLDANGYYDGCLLMEDNGYVFVPISVLEEIGSEITVTAWLYTGKAQGDDNIVLAAGADWEDYYMRLSVPDDSADIYWRAGNETNDVMIYNEGSSPGWEDNWNHFAVVKDENNNKMQIYLNGVRVAEQSGTSSGTLALLRYREIRMGAETDDNDSYDGKIDEFRIYDRALSADEIASIFRGGNLGSAWAPSPMDNQPDVPRDVTLNWRPGDYAVEHDVYFGTAWDDVNDADTTSGVYINRRGPNSYDPPGNLELDKTYYWRIDEVNDADVNSPWKGNVWRFTVANFIVIDDFESYDKIGDPQIWWTWENPDDTGSWIALGVAPFQPVRMGAKSMEYAYDNTDQYSYGYYSETVLTFASPENWTVADVKTLTLFFYGDPDNDVNSSEQLYVGLEDSATDYFDIDYPTMSDIQVEEWQEWNLILSDFTDVDQDSIKKIYIGFGDPAAVAPGGEGVVYMDDVRLYPPKCVPEFGPVADLSDNCIVDLADIGILSVHWLRSDKYLSTTAPVASPVGHWELETGSGTTAIDSSTNNNHGTLEGNYLWVDGHVGSKAVDFSGGRALVPDAAVLRSMSQVTVMAWIYSERSQSAARVVVKGADNRETYELEASGETDVDFVVREDGNESSFVRHAVSSDTLVLNEWIHLAGSYDQSDIKVYVNGQLEASDTIGAFTISQDPNGLAIGNRSDDDNRAFYGKIDDVRVYATALQADEIAHIATKETGYVPLQSLANLYDSEPAGQKVINFRDYAVIMDSWLEEKLWPQE